MRNENCEAAQTYFAPQTKQSPGLQSLFNRYFETNQQQQHDYISAAHMQGRS
jgi:streptomycin 6-kinase